MIECTIIDNNTGKVLSKNFQLTNDEIQKNKTSKDLKIRGIYKITYIPTGQVYIGSSTNIQSRWVEHKRDLNNNKHHSWKLQKVWDKEENKDNFKFEIVELVDKKTKLFDREQYWIDYYDAASHENFNILQKAGYSFYTDDILNFKILQQEKCGKFIFFDLNAIPELTNLLGDTDIVKFIMLSTYIGKDNILKLDNNITYITKDMLKEILKVKQKRFGQVYKILIETGLLILKDDNYCINKKYSTKRLQKNNKINNFTKIYIRQIRTMYNSIIINKEIPVFTKLLPYVNNFYNILCENPECDNLNAIKYLKASDISKKINYNINNSAKLMKRLCNLKINNEYIIKQINISQINKKGYIVNPKIIYKVLNFKLMTILIDIFENNKEELIFE